MKWLKNEAKEEIIKPTKEETQRGNRGNWLGNFSTK